jgi:hypothetical protein
MAKPTSPSPPSPPIKEIPKRLAPSGDTLRELFLKSGNLCAMPGCERLMMNSAGLFVGIVCHIEAALVVTRGAQWSRDSKRDFKVVGGKVVERTDDDPDPYEEDKGMP